MRKYLILISFLLLISTLALCGFAEEATEPEAAPLLSVEAVWKLPPRAQKEPIHSFFYIPDNKYIWEYTGKNGSSYHCYSSEGKLIWKTAEEMHSLYQFSNYLLLRNLTTNKVTCISPDSGEEIWSNSELYTYFIWPKLPFFLYNDQLIYIQLEPYAIDMKTGKKTETKYKPVKGMMQAALQDDDSVWLLTATAKSRTETSYEIRKRSLVTLEDTLCVQISQGPEPDMLLPANQMKSRQGCGFFDTGESVIAYGFHGTTRMNKKTRKLDYADPNVYLSPRSPEPFVLGDTLVYKESFKNSYKKLSFDKGVKDEKIDFEEETIGVLAPMKLLVSTFKTDPYVADVFDTSQGKIQKVGKLDCSKYNVLPPVEFKYISKNKAIAITCTYPERTRCIVVLKRNRTAEKEEP